ncbi:MAG: aminopeptidase [Clostridiales bacterium]|jgi:putative aminopeptidase FrvX|nr:aminopeptidase [Clostridiales bacterium]
MEKYLDYMVDEIVNLAKIPSPTGYADRAINYVASILKGLNVGYRITKKGALIASIDGVNNDMERTISAHVDTLGAMVKGIKGTGHLCFDTLGGYMMSAVEDENCIVETVDGKTYTGTILTTKPSPHIHGNEAKQLERKLENMEIVLDERVASKEEVEGLGIGIGDFVFLDPRTQVTSSGFIKSRHLDDKASAGILIGVIKYMVENKILPPYKTNFFFSTYEEVGHGASASIPQNTFEFLAVDMGAPGEGQNSSEFAVCICAKDSSGPYDYDFRKRLVELCKINNIDYKIDMYPYYGSDASAALRAGYDFKTGLIGTGVFASHSYERTHKDGVLNTAKLVVGYINSK